jgi:Archaeal MCM, winged-helix
MEDFKLTISEAMKHRDLTGTDPYLRFKFTALIHIRYGEIGPYFESELESALISHIRILEKEIRDMGKDPTVPDKDWFEVHRIIHDDSLFKGLEDDRDKIRAFVAAVKKFEDKNRGMAPKYAVFNELLEHGMIEDEADEMLRILKSKRVIYEPQKGYLKLG